MKCWMVKDHQGNYLRWWAPSKTKALAMFEELTGWPSWVAAEEHGYKLVKVTITEGWGDE